MEMVDVERESFQLLSSKSPARGSLNEILCTTAASLSIVGTLVIIGTFLKWPDLRSNSRKIIVCISIGDLFVAISNVVGLYTETCALVCKIQATLNIAAILSSFFWTVYLSFYIYMTVCRKITPQSEKRIMLFFVLTAWGIPLIIAATAYGVGAVGNSDNVVSSGWCWIKYILNDETNWPWQKMLFWMCMAGKGWEILAYFAICVFYFLVKWQIRREINRGFPAGSHFLTVRSIEVVRKADRKLMFIPVVFILLRIWGTIRFFRMWVYYPSPPSPIKWLILLHGVGDSSQGFANFVLFCLFTDKIREKLRLCGSNQERDPLFESTNLTYGAKN